MFLTSICKGKLSKELLEIYLVRQMPLGSIDVSRRDQQGSREHPFFILKALGKSWTEVEAGNLCHCLAEPSVTSALGFSICSCKMGIPLSPRIVRITSNTVSPLWYHELLKHRACVTFDCCQPELWIQCFLCTRPPGTDGPIKKLSGKTL